MARKATKKPTPTPHEHKFKRTGMTIWCSCGERDHIRCAHKWSLNKRENIEFDKPGGVGYQNEETYTCDTCGAVRHTNTTTGRTTIIH